MHTKLNVFSLDMGEKNKNYLDHFMVKRDEFIIIFKNEDKQFKFDFSNFQHMRNNYGNYTFCVIITNVWDNK